MNVSKEQVEQGIVKFIENEIGNKATGITKFATFFALPIVTKKAGQIIDSFAENEITKDFFDNNKNINIDEVYNMAKSAIQRSGQFTWLGMIFSESDIDKLYNYIRG